MAPPFLHFPKPRSFLHLIPLSTATEFISFTLAINKVTGVYGLLALLTGYHLSPLQLSHYIYSLVVLALLLYLTPSIRQPRDTNSTLKVLGLAWVYVLDTLINSVYTALFGLGWFVVLAQHLNDDTPATGSSGMGPGGQTINDTAGFTDPEHTVSQVEVVATPASGAFASQKATAYGSAAGGSLGGALFGVDGISSLTILGLLWLTRIYFCIVVLSFARSTLRAYVANQSASSTSYTAPAPEDSTMASNPFSSATSGWRGTVGRLMLRFPTQRYWLGRDESEEEWARQTSSRLESARGLRIKVPTDGGLGERERRARSGTGPPAPMGLKGKVPE
ncbi:hypothetical protein LTR53_003754 [Teratosphaeriaceae sp. CCFEE 6253]|nr:hypothetical protein LTR53_003754 [Teratosphaeriaceae sp. CCFEE 6253]